MNIQYLNRRDEQKRLYECKTYLTNKESSQSFTDTYSYKFGREQLKSCGIPMGFDCNHTDWVKYLKKNEITSRKYLELELNKNNKDYMK